MLNDADHKKFIEDEVAEMVAYKKKKDKEAGRDLGDGPIFEWIENESEEFRKNWMDTHT